MCQEYHKKPIVVFYLALKCNCNASRSSGTQKIRIKNLIFPLNKIFCDISSHLEKILNEFILYERSSDKKTTGSNSYIFFYQHKLLVWL